LDDEGAANSRSSTTCDLPLDATLPARSSRAQERSTKRVAPYARIRTGVPSGNRRASRSITSLRTRMQPCETSAPSARGAFVPWIPIWPSPPAKLV
jgi:hypothetical protein